MNAALGERDVVSLAAHLHPAQGWGGVAASAFRLARWLDDHQRLDVAVATRSSRVGPDLTLSAVAEAGLPRVRLARSLPGAFCRRNAVAPGLVFTVARALWPGRRARFLLVHGVGTFSAAVGPAVARLLRVPYAVIAHGGLMQPYRDTFSRRRVKRWVYRFVVDPQVRRADVIVVASEFERCSSVLATDSRVLVMPNAVSPHAAAPPMEAGTPLRLCYVGRISAEKGIAEFAKLFAASARLGEQLVVAGSGSGPYHQALVDLATDAPDRIALLGEVSAAEIPGAMARAHFVVLPTKLGPAACRENFGNTVAEALAIGRPAIASAGMAWDDLETHSAGFTMGSSPKEVLAALERARGIAADPQQHDDSCRNARRYAQSHFGEERYLELLDWIARHVRRGMA